MRPRVPKLRSEIVPASSLTPESIDQMWHIFDRYYADVTFKMFRSDLAEKSDVILVRDRKKGDIQGFSTLQILKVVVEGKPVVAIFSGDTIIEKEYWGQTALQRAFFRYIVKVKASHPRHAVYWFLISKGYKTYLLLARNFPEHWPRHDKRTPPWQTKVLDRLAKKKFGDSWIPEKGILRFATSHGRLREDVAAIDQHLLRYPDIRFFEETNPGHPQGDELCCIGRVDWRLATSYPLKLVKKLVRRKKRRSKTSRA